MKKPKPRKQKTLEQLRAAGYVTPLEAAAALTEMVKNLRRRWDQEMVKFSITFWYAELPTNDGGKEKEG